MAGISSTLVNGKRYWSLVFRYKGIEVKEPLRGCSSKEEAVRLKKKIERQMLEGTFDYLKWFSNSHNLSKLGLNASGEKLTLGEYATTWLQKKRHLVAYKWYEGTIRNHILTAEIVQKPLSEIVKSDIELLVANLRDVTGPRAVNGAIARLRSIFSDAFYDDLIDKDPMLKVLNVREGRPKIDPYMVEEVIAIIFAASGGARVLLIVLFFTGMRPNEALTLKWTDVDWRRRLISVSRMGGRVGIHLPKTKGSERDVVMLDVVYEALQEQRSRSELKSKHGWIFPSEADTPIRLENFRDREWKKIVKAARVKPRTLYQTRHTFATLMLAYETVQWVAAQLGHTSIQMVVSRYAKWIRTPESRAMGDANAEFSQALGGRSSFSSDRRQVSGDGNS